MRFFIILFFCIVSLYSKSVRDSIITDVLLSTDNKNYISIEKVEDFKEPVFTAKFILNTTILKDKNFYLKILAESEYIKSSSLSYILKNDLPVYKINKNTPSELIIAFDYKNNIPLLQIGIFTETEYTYIMSEEKLIFGITYGIIFCALLYNLAFYYFNRQKSFLYYSLMQFSTIILLLIIAMPIKLFYTIFQYINIFDISVDLIIIFSILFSMEFLNSKKHIPIIHKLWVCVLSISLIDLFIIPFHENTFVYEYIPTFIPIGIGVVAAVFVLIKGNKPALFYIIGWMIIFISVFIVDTEIFDINETYILHFAFPFEALVFSFAIGYKMKLIEAEKQKNEQLMIHQSRLASMGEMVANIAHQWRQPLTHLSYAHMNLKTAYDQEKLSSEYFNKKTEEVNDQIEFMSHTIDDFSNFFKSDKKSQGFGILNTIENTHRLLMASFKHSGITVDIQCKSEVFINSYENEFSQVLFNLLNNAKQELIEKKIESPKIIVEIIEQRKTILIKITDNAMGIDEKIIEKIFEPYFTTKDSGMGIGLYMSKVIIEEHMNGKLSVKNIPNGVTFEISVPKG